MNNNGMEKCFAPRQMLDKKNAKKTWEIYYYTKIEKKMGKKIARCGWYRSVNMNGLPLYGGWFG